MPKLKCPLCDGTGRVWSVKHPDLKTYYALLVETLRRAKQGTCCPLCKGKKRITQRQLTAFRLVYPEYPSLMYGVPTADIIASIRQVR
jgi:hypothetical protein